MTTLNNTEEQELPINLDEWADRQIKNHNAYYMRILNREELQRRVDIFLDYAKENGDEIEEHHRQRLVDHISKEIGLYDGVEGVVKPEQVEESDYYKFLRMRIAEWDQAMLQMYPPIDFEKVYGKKIEIEPMTLDKLKGAAERLERNAGPFRVSMGRMDDHLNMSAILGLDPRTFNFPNMFERRMRWVDNIILNTDTHGERNQMNKKEIKDKAIRIIDHAAKRVDDYLKRIFDRIGNELTDLIKNK